ncbi:MAG: hypothetical protein IJC38_06070 [Erysipelotrichaceae bacterium]|nr:hypothetical protein [Erysipelotrichaceae bacterium]
MKKMIKVLLASLLLVSMTAVSVCAEGSPIIDGTVGEWEGTDDAGTELSPTLYELVFQPLESHHLNPSEDHLYETMEAVNAGTQTIADLLAEAGVLPSNYKDVTILTPVRDLTFKELISGDDVVAKNVTVTFEVPNLTEGMGEIFVYHHSTLTGKDELIRPISIDYANKAITVFFTDLSPVAVVAMNFKPASAPVDTAAKDYTGLFAGLALAAALGLIVLNKKEKTAA